MPVRKEASLRPLTYTTEPAASSSQELADRGFRALGVAVLYDDIPDVSPEELAAFSEADAAKAREAKAQGKHHKQAVSPCPGQGRWEFLGILSLFDPPVSGGWGGGG